MVEGGGGRRREGGENLNTMEFALRHGHHQGECIHKCGNCQLSVSNFTDGE